jgi:hypothetical protein
LLVGNACVCFDPNIPETALHYRNEADRAHHREGMLKSGLPA